MIFSHKSCKVEYCIANIVVNEAVFPEFYGPNLTEGALFAAAHRLWFDEGARGRCLAGCDKVQQTLGTKRAAAEAAEVIIKFNLSSLSAS